MCHCVQVCALLMCVNTITHVAIGLQLKLKKNSSKHMIYSYSIYDQIFLQSNTAIPVFSEIFIFKVNLSKKPFYT